MTENSNRIDKFLWAVRIYKTRSMAAEACRKGRVFINNQEVKAARIIKLGDIILVKKNPVNYTYEILGILQNRIGAALVPKYIKDLTPKEELDKLVLANNNPFFYRERGQGRPTKKDRREIDRIIDEGNPAD